MRRWATRPRQAIDAACVVLALVMALAAGVSRAGAITRELAACALRDSAGARVELTLVVAAAVARQQALRATRTNRLAIAVFAREVALAVAATFAGAVGALTVARRPSATLDVTWARLAIEVAVRISVAGARAVRAGAAAIGIRATLDVTRRGIAAERTIAVGCAFARAVGALPGTVGVFAALDVTRWCNTVEVTGRAFVADACLVFTVGLHRTSREGED